MAQLRVWSWLNTGLTQLTHLLWRDVERNSAEVHTLVRVDAGYHEEDAGTLKNKNFKKNVSPKVIILDFFLTY